MADKELTFTAGQFDRDGDLFDSGLFLNVGDTSIRFDSPDAMERFADQVKAMVPEARETWHTNIGQ